MMMKVKIEGLDEFSKAMQLAYAKSSKDFPVFLHDQAQRFMWQMHKTFHADRPSLQTIDSGALGSLNSGRGLRVNRRNRKKAEALMGKYKEYIDETVKKEQQKSATAKQREKIKMLNEARNKLRIRYRGHNKTVTFYKPTYKPASQRYKTHKRLNLPALAAQYEIKRRHSGSGSMGNAFLEGWKKLRALPLGSPFAFAQICKDRFTWANSAEMKRGAYMLDMTLENKGFRAERPRNYERLSRVLKTRGDDMLAHLDRKMKEILK